MSRIMIVPFEKATFKDGEVVIDDVTCTFTQNPDCTEDRDAGDVQELKVSTRNNGMARFINIKTGESGWSISDAHELDEIIQKFSEMVNLDSAQEEQKPEVDLERDAVQFCFDKGLNITPYQAKTIASHFYELGKKGRINEQH